MSNAGTIHAIGGGFPLSDQFRGEIQSHRFGIFIELLIELGRIEFPGAVETFAGRGHKDRRRGRALIESLDQLLCGLDPRIDHFVAIGCVPASCEIEYMLPGEVDDDVAGRETLPCEILPRDLPRGRGPGQDGYPVAPRLQRSREGASNKSAAAADNDVTLMWHAAARYPADLTITI